MFRGIEPRHPVAVLSLTESHIPGWRFACPECGVFGEGISPRHALSNFRLAAEKAEVERVRAIPASERTEREERVLAYSPYGSA